MRRRKKTLALLLAVVLCFGIVPANTVSVNVYAAEEQVSSYGEQLTPVQVEMYDALVKRFVDRFGYAKEELGEVKLSLKNAESYDSPEAMKSAFAIDLGYAVNAFIEDYPQVFWVSGYRASYSYYTSLNQVADVTITLENAMDATTDNVEDFNDDLEDVVEMIKESLPRNATSFDKYIAIHDWICERAYYDENGRSNPSAYPETHTAYPIFEESRDGGVVCEGYAKAYKILCDQMGLECMLVLGDAMSNGSYEAHMWNKVLMSDGNWYVVDATWDDQGQDLYYDYFLCGKQSPCFNGLTFEQDHLESNAIVSGVEFEYPEIPAYGYSGYLGNLSYSYNAGTLIIEGEGNWPVYLNVDRVPWYQYKDEITSVLISEDITTINEGIFQDYDCLENLTIPYVGLSKTATGENAVLGAIFGKTGETGTPQYHTSGGGYYYDIPNSLKKIVVTDDNDLEFGAFSNCSNLQSIILNRGINCVSSWSFYNCSSLMEIAIPDSVTDIALAALEGCDNLKRITIPFVGTNANVDSGIESLFGYIFGYGDQNDILQYYDAWGCYYDIPTSLQAITITKDTTIPYGAFSSCDFITEINLKSNVVDIGKFAFYGCTSLKNITFYGDAPSINDYAFYECGELTANVLNDNNTWTKAKKNYSAQMINWITKNPTDVVAQISSARISLGDQIAIKFMVTLENSVSDDDYLLVSIDNKQTKIKVKDTTTVQSDLTGETKHVFVYKVNSKQMTKSIQAQMVVDEYAGTTVTYSVKKYADALLGLADGTYEKEKTMIRAMLNYGGYAQKYFKDESAFANADIYNGSNDPVVAIQSVNLEAYKPSGENVQNLTATLLLESETELRFYFIPENGTTLEDYSFEVTGSNKSYVTGTNGNKCYISIPGICANELQEMYTVTIRIKNTNTVYAAVTYGALSYVRTILQDSSSDNDMKNLVKALYLYNQAAVAYGK